MELINKKEFAKVVLDQSSEPFILYLTALEAETLFHASYKAQIAAL